MAVEPIWHHFWTLIFFELFGVEIDFFRQIDQNWPKRQKSTKKWQKSDFNRGFEAIFGHWISLNFLGIRSIFFVKWTKKLQTSTKKLPKSDFNWGLEDICGSKYILWVKIILVNPRFFEKPKIAHNFLNNGRRAVLTPFLDIYFFWTFWG